MAKKTPQFHVLKAQVNVSIAMGKGDVISSVQELWYNIQPQMLRRLKKDAQMLRRLKKDDEQFEALKVSEIYEALSPELARKLLDLLIPQIHPEDERELADFVDALMDPGHSFNLSSKNTQRLVDALVGSPLLQELLACISTYIATVKEQAEKQRLAHDRRTAQANIASLRRLGYTVTAPKPSK